MAMAFLKKTSNLLLHHHPIGSLVAARKIGIPSSIRFLNDRSNTRLLNFVEENDVIDRTSSSLSDSFSRLRRDSSPNLGLSDAFGQSSSPSRGPRMDNNFQFTNPPRGRTAFTGLRRVDATENDDGRNVKANTVVVNVEWLISRKAANSLLSTRGKMLTRWHSRKEGAVAPHAHPCSALLVTPRANSRSSTRRRRDLLEVKKISKDGEDQCFE
ncbi:hypothetical protein MKW98_015036 [Papaver atlanticum]|uniref:Uncharacterized protein n=1 Tax=Papaver atlanticum TaxID=357466 RepID=A0AAD4S6Z3_9MAGN|nr:hypothetical protein MKW98_015036 [Papaver atlanticum]